MKKPCFWIEPERIWIDDQESVLVEPTNHEECEDNLPMADVSCILIARGKRWETCRFGRQSLHYEKWRKDRDERRTKRQAV